MCYMYWHITTTLNRMAMMMGSNATEDRLTAMASHLKYYPLIFIISWIPNTIIRILQATDPNFNKSYDIAMAERHPPPARSMSSRSRLAQSQDEEEKKKERRKIPIFCLAAILANAGVFVVEIWVNGWQLQPFSCPSTCSNGMPCYEDGFTECEPNPMLGPRIAVLQRLGAKDDLAIFERGEWWRIMPPTRKRCPERTSAQWPRRLVYAQLLQHRAKRRP